MFRLPLIPAADLAQAAETLNSRGCAVSPVCLREARICAGQGCPPVRYASSAMKDGACGRKLFRPAETRLTIPMRGRAESLNAAMAAGIVMWELMPLNGGARKKQRREQAWMPGLTGSGCSRRWGREWKDRPPAFPFSQRLRPCGRPRRNSGYRLASQRGTGSPGEAGPGQRPPPARRCAVRRGLGADAGGRLLSERFCWDLPDFPLALYGRASRRIWSDWPAVGWWALENAKRRGPPRGWGILPGSWPFTAWWSSAAGPGDAASHWGSVVCRGLTVACRPAA